MPGKRSGLIGAAVALAVIGTSTSALTGYQRTASPATAGSWLALSLLYEGNATLVTAPCGAATAAEGSGSQEPPPAPPPPKTDQPPPSPPIGCLPVSPPPTTGRRLGVYVGIAVAAAAGIGAAVAVGGKRHPNSAP